MTSAPKHTVMRDAPEWRKLVDDYRRNGVVAVPRLVSPSDIADVRVALRRYIRDTVPHLPPGDLVREADGVSVRNLWRMEKYDDYFAALGNREDILHVVGALLGGKPVLCAVETFNKPARHGSGVPQHQDNAYFCQDPPDMCTVWIAIDAATEQNGPVQYARGTTHTLLPHRASGIPGNSMVMSQLREYPAEQVTTAILEPGDAMIHHCQTVHWSTPNHTDYNRCGLLLVYRASHTRTDPALRELYTQAAAAFAARQDPGM
ncbi:phytanoyl-CoA dioxygenase family protein [Micromonospora sp. DR5-3]|uniref:phytanoyl-CoA dioxygenase family protein n=1 Tax=unclassified Micromonospora TaxID=2617518 RepID=UPI0016529E41|nr:MULTISPECIES: phytanoyl-CoA dioxygenase family protein [unclassified Micromonospora]MCW3818919.1 phytanoyl-CoA dioxygenase family protein [Micromonospora sp. DR5-3]